MKDTKNTNSSKKDLKTKGKVLDNNTTYLDIDPELIQSGTSTLKTSNEKVIKENSTTMKRVRIPQNYKESDQIHFVTEGS